MVQSTYQPKPQVPLQLAHHVSVNTCFFKGQPAASRSPGGWDRHGGPSRERVLSSSSSRRRDSGTEDGAPDRASGSRLSASSPVGGSSSLSALLSSLLCRTRVVIVSPGTQKEHREEGGECAPEGAARPNSSAPARALPKAAAAQKPQQRKDFYQGPRGRANSCPTWSRTEHTRIELRTQTAGSPDSESHGHGKKRSPPLSPLPLFLLFGGWGG